MLRFIFCSICFLLFPFLLLGQIVNSCQNNILGNDSTINFGVTIQLGDVFTSTGNGVSDIDGNSYTTAIIGSQEWMSENLKTTKFSNGNIIPNVISNSNWNATNTPAWCYWGNSSSNNTEYGKLYNWYTGNDSLNLCPTGWKVPTKNDFDILRNNYDYNGAGAELKEAGFAHWKTPNTGATNLSGFTALPGGYRDVSGFACIGNGGSGTGIINYNSIGYYWAADAYDSIYGNIIGMHNYLSNMNGFRYLKESALSVRCVKNLSTCLWSTGDTTTTISVSPNQTSIYWLIRIENGNSCVDSITITVINSPYGCTDSTALNYDSTATIDDGTCIYPVFGCTDSIALNYNPLATTDDGTCQNLFFSEYAEGNFNNKYFEVYNPTSDTVDLSNYAYPNVSNAPTTQGVYEYWNEFDAGSVVFPNDVYVVAHASADVSILAEADETHNYLSNGDDGYALVFGDQTSYQVIDWLGDWNGDPGSGWDVAGVTNGTKDHTLVRKCDVISGDTSWINSAGTDSLNSQWTVYPQNTWTYLGSHVHPCYTPVHNITQNIDYRTIQSGLDAAVAGDTVVVDPDIYYENLVWPSVNGIVLMSSGDSSNTIIDGSGSDVITISSNIIDNTTKIIGFGLTNWSNSTHGISINQSSPHLLNLNIVGTSQSNGTCIEATSVQSLIVENCYLSTASTGVKVSPSSSSGSNLIKMNKIIACSQGVYVDEYGSYGSGGYDVLVTQNIIYSNNIGVKTIRGNPDIHDNIILNNNIPLDLNGWTCGSNVCSGMSPEVLNNVIAYNNEGSHLRNVVSLLKNNLFYKNNGYDLLDIPSYNSYKIASPSVNYNHFVSNSVDYLLVNGLENYDATNNFWGAIDTDSIGNYVYDGYDDPNLGFITYIPFITTPDLATPIAPPLNTLKPASPIPNFTWDASLESDVVGYRIYYGNYNGYSFDNYIDVGNVTSVSSLLLNTYLDSIVAITAYDALADGVNDQLENHESWFSFFNIREFYGCTDSLALNYDPIFTVDDSSCIYTFTNFLDTLNSCDSIEICVDSINGGVYSWTTSNILVSSYDTLNCVWVSNSGWNYITLTTPHGIIFSDSILVNLVPCVFGCTDTSALNYNILANTDDGSCTYYTPVHNITQNIDYRTIQSGLDAAVTGDTVVVDPDIYYENLIWPAVNGIVLMSSGDSSNTIIDGSGSDVITISSNIIDNTTKIIGFGLTNWSNSSHGISINQSSPHLLNLNIVGSSQSNGTCIEATSVSSLIIENCYLSTSSTGIKIYPSSSSGSNLIKMNKIIACSQAVYISEYGSYGSGGHDVLVSQNIIHSNNVGVTTIRGNPDIHDNIIVNNNIPLDLNGWTCGPNVCSGMSPEVLNNVIAYNNEGSHLRNVVSLLKNNLFYKNDGYDLLDIPSYNGYKIASPSVNYNHFVSNSVDYLLVNGLENYDATNNFWGAIDTDSIGNYVYDGYDDPNLGFITYIPFLTTPDLTTPIAPPLNTTKSFNPSLEFSWDASLESDVVGYRIYYGNYNGYSFDNYIDVGNVTSVSSLLLNTYLDSVVAITAYDALADGVNDQLENHESWFSFIDIEVLNGCRDSLANNYNPFATVDDSTCLYSPFVFGCTDSTALNYNLLATVDDSSCCYNSSNMIAQCIVADYPFNGNTNDESGNGNNANVYGANLTLDRFGNANSAYVFDGTNYIEAANLYSQSFTINLWVKTSNDGIYFCKHYDASLSNSSYMLYSHISSNCQPRLYYTNQNLSAIDVLATSTVCDNNWHMITATLDSIDLKIYIDGVFENQSSGGTAQLTSFPSLIGARYDNSGNVIEDFIGVIDDIKYFNCALTSQQVDSIWNIESSFSNTCSDIGCLDPLALNFDAFATIDDSSCVYPNYGCIDSLASNYNSLSNIDDGSCNYCVNDTSYTNITACDSVEWHGVWYDSSGTYYSNTVYNNNYSMSFDGIDDEIILSDLTINNSFSFETYVFISSLTDLSRSDAGRHIFSTGANNSTWASFAFGISDITLGATQPTIVCEFGSPSSNQFIASQSFPLDNWVHIVVTFDNGQLDVYQNGINVLSNSTGLSVSTNAYNSRIGNRGSNWGNNAYQFEGYISYLSYWNSILSQHEIQNYMNCPPTGSETGLVGYWNFEEGSGNTVYDQTSNGNDGTINGATYDTNVPAQSCQLTNVNGCDSVAVLNLTINQSDTSFTNITACDSIEWNGEWYDSSGTYYSNIVSNNNYSMNFDGNNDYVLSNLYNNFNNQMSVGLWFKSNQLGQDSKLLYTGSWTNSGTRNFNIKLTNNGIIFILSIQGNNQFFVETGNNYIVDTLWHNIFATYDNNYIKLYIDGLIFDSVNVVGNINNVNDLYFGTRNPLGEYFDGSLDEVQLWDKALNHIEIQSYMSCPPIGNETGLVGYWNFDEGSGNTVYDLTSNGNDGTINGALYDTNVPIQSCQLTNDNGCDSVAVLNLTINQSDTSFTNITACDSVEWNGTWYDSSGTYYSNTVSNNNYSMSFDGNDDYIEINSFTRNANTDLTINIYAKGTGNMTCTKTPGYESYFEYQNDVNGNRIGFHLGILQTNSGNEWSVSNLGDLSTDYQFYSITVDDLGNGSTLSEVFLNGISLGQHTYPYSIPSYSFMEMGRNIVEQNAYYDGVIAEVQFWDGILTQQEIQNYMQCPPTGNESGLVGYWNFEEGSGSTVFDQTLNGNDGTINGATYDTNVPALSCQLTNVNGCDSVAVLNLTINQSDTSFTNITACDSVEWNGEWYDSTGTYYFSGNQQSSISGFNFSGSIGNSNYYISNSLASWYDADSICNIFGGHLVAINNPNENNFINGLANNQVLWIGLEQNTNNINFIEPSGGWEWVNNDSLNYTNWGIGEPNNMFAPPCNLQNHTVINTSTSFWDDQCGQALRFFVLEIPSNLQTINGCDSIAVLNLTINNSSNNAVTVTACDSYNWDGVTYTSTGLYTNLYSDINGCDSTVTLDLTINNSSSNTITSTSCDSLVWNGVTFTSTGIYTNTFTAVNGCDSIVNLDLTIINSYSNIVSLTVCNSFIWDGVTYDSTGVYTNSYSGLNGCDSSVTFDLTVNYSESSTEVISLCDSIFTWGGIIYDTPGNYSNVLVFSNALGCDSAVTLDLTLGFTDTTYYTVDICDSSYIWNGVTYNSTGIYSNTYSGFNGCDSIVIIDLTIYNSSTDTISVVACDSYDWDGTTYTSTGQYTNVYTDVNSCDSTIILDLTINNNSSLTVTITSCDDFTWDGTTYNSTGIYTNVYSDINGCDSTVTLDLTINNSSTNTVTVISCDSYSWDGFTYDSTGVYTNLYSDQNGCDSLVTLDLTINNSTTNTISIIACDSYSWDGFTYDSTGVYTNLYSDQNGCDSTVTLDLIINYSNSTYLTDTACDFYIWNGITYNASGLYSFNFTNIYGCDSTIILNLFIDPCSIYGCTDSLALNFDTLATIDDSSCIYYNCQEPAPTNVYSSDIADVRATINWDNMNSNDCKVLKYVIRYRELGTSQWTVKSGGIGNGLCNFGVNNTSRILYNLASSTTYQYRIKAYYCYGGSSLWTLPKYFTTDGDCPPITNLSTQTFPNNTNKVRFSWDSTGAYVFARVALRVDTTGSSWQTAGGFGVYYPTLFVNKFGLQQGQSYRAQGRAFCDSNITSYRSWWTAPIFWTQPGLIRLEGGSAINNLDVYPNPSRNIFNISFNSEKQQNLTIRILNVVGAEIYSEDRENYIGDYTKQINLGKYGKGIYFLEIETYSGIVNKKLILQ